MNVIISIQDFKIIIKDLIIKKVIRKITESELIFCKNHNFLMYSKSTFAVSHVKIKKLKNNSFKKKDDCDFKDDVFNIKDLKTSFF